MEKTSNAVLPECSAAAAGGALAERIARRTGQVVVIGLGYVGLPLSLEAARAGFRVTGIDVVREKVAALERGESYVEDVAPSSLKPLLDEGRFRPTTDFGALDSADAVIICVPTPLRKTKDPDIGFVLAAVREVARRVHRDELIVLESTTYPGTTEELLIPELTAGGLRVGEDIFVAFSPERIDPGNQRFTLRNTPKVIGGATARCTAMAAALYGAFIDRVVPVSSPRAAEMVKLLENTFRAVNIGLVNETAIMCDKIGVDAWEVIDAAATKPFGYMPFYPGPGLGGHCIPIDPLYLSWKLKALNYNARFIELASEVNSHMPDVVVERALLALNRERKCANGARILVVGVAYKRDVSDVRESPALDIIRLLRSLGADVAYHDPKVPSLRHEGIDLETTSLEPTPDVRAYDLVIVATDHRACDYGRLVDEATLVLDCRNATRAVGLRPNVLKL